jgi:hypothetical protein
MLMVPRGGHSFLVWRAMEPVAFDWISRLLPEPLSPPMMAERRGVVPYHGPVPAPLPKPLIQASRHRAKAARPKFQ